MIQSDQRSHFYSSRGGPHLTDINTLGPLGGGEALPTVSSATWNHNKTISAINYDTTMCNYGGGQTTQNRSSTAISECNSKTTSSIISPDIEDRAVHPVRLNSFLHCFLVLVTLKQKQILRLCLKSVSTNQNPSPRLE